MIIPGVLRQLSKVRFAGATKWLFTVSSLVLIIVLSFPMAVHASDQDVVDYREHIMNTLNEQAGALGEILSGAIPAENATAHLEAISLGASIALKAFERKVPGGEAKPDVWSKWADFSKRMNDFAQGTAAAVSVAKSK